MGLCAANQAPPMLLVVSLLSVGEEPRKRALLGLEARLGPLCFLSAPLAFDWTDYYRAEMGGPLTRRLAALENLVEAHRLPEIKELCLKLEEEESREGRRRVNLDPGLLSTGALILATTKWKAHRTPLERGLWAELTLIYQNGAFGAMPWTYADWAGPELGALLFRLRERYKWRLKAPKTEMGAMA